MLFVLLLGEVYFVVVCGLHWLWVNYGCGFYNEGLLWMNGGVSLLRVWVCRVAN